MQKGHDVRVLRSRLLRWYDRQHRDLPWRRPPFTGDPYAIWVSEVMLQQTRVSVVAPYYLKFMARFPTVAALARAHEASVLRLWSGLGYYRRARQLVAAAREITNIHGGEFPREVETVLSLPGVGRYTAGAVLSIAYGQRLPAIDGNVQRVAQRVSGQALASRDIERMVIDWVPFNRPGDFNQGLMELGATICLPQGPLCDRCPVAAICAHQQHGSLEMRRKTQSPHVKLIQRYTLQVSDGRVRLERRNKNEPLMAGMWELPRHRRGGKRLGAVRHAITYRTITAEVWEKAQAGEETSGRKSESHYFTRRQAWALPLTGLSRKILRQFWAEVI